MVFKLCGLHLSTTPIDASSRTKKNGQSDNRYKRRNFRASNRSDKTTPAINKPKITKRYLPPNKIDGMITPESYRACQDSSERDSLIARNIVLSATTDLLQSLGPSEMGRLAHTINQNNNPITQVTDQFLDMRDRNDRSTSLRKLLIEQDTEIEEKLQIAFSRAYGSSVMSFGEKMFERLLMSYNIRHYGEDPTPSIEEREALLAFLVNDQGQSLRGLGVDEINYLEVKLFSRFNTCQASRIEEQALNIFRRIHSKATTPSMRLDKPRNTVEQIPLYTFEHTTTLYVKLCKTILACLDNRPNTQSTKLHHREIVNQLFLSAVHNHLEPSLLHEMVIELFKDIEPSALSDIDALCRNFIGKLHPTDNVGRQMASPYARRLENAFAKECFKKPTDAMVAVSVKIINQLKEGPIPLRNLILSYYSGYEYSIYPTAQKDKIAFGHVSGKLNSGTDLLLTFDFLHFCAERYMELVSYSVQEELKRYKNVITYDNGIQKMRGKRVYLPHLNSLENVHHSIGIGSQSDAIPCQKQVVRFRRPCERIVSFGPHQFERV